MKGSNAKVNTILQKEFKQPQSTLILIFQSTSLDANSTTYKQVVTKTLSKMDKIKDIKTIASPYEGQDMVDGKIAYATLTFDKGAINSSHFFII